MLAKPASAGVSSTPARQIIRGILEFWMEFWTPLKEPYD
jgi:hypothetical protein